MNLLFYLILILLVAWIYNFMDKKNQDLLAKNEDLNKKVADFESLKGLLALLLKPDAEKIELEGYEKYISLYPRGSAHISATLYGDGRISAYASGVLKEKTGDFIPTTIEEVRAYFPEKAEVYWIYIELYNHFIRNKQTKENKEQKICDKKSDNIENRIPKTSKYEHIKIDFSGLPEWPQDQDWRKLRDFFAWLASEKEYPEFKEWLIDNLQRRGLTMEQLKKALYDYAISNNRNFLFVRDKMVNLYRDFLNEQENSFKSYNETSSRAFADCAWLVIEHQKKKSNEPFIASHDVAEKLVYVGLSHTGHKTKRYLNYDCDDERASVEKPFLDLITYKFKDENQRKIIKAHLMLFKESRLLMIYDVLLGDDTEICRQVKNKLNSILSEGVSPFAIKGSQEYFSILSKNFRLAFSKTQDIKKIFNFAFWSTLAEKYPDWITLHGVADILNNDYLFKIFKFSYDAIETAYKEGVK